MEKGGMGPANRSVQSAPGNQTRDHIDHSAMIWIDGAGMEMQVLFVRYRCRQSIDIAPTVAVYSVFDGSGCCHFLIVLARLELRPRDEDYCC